MMLAQFGAIGFEFLRTDAEHSQSTAQLERQSVGATELPPLKVCLSRKHDNHRANSWQAV
jgi:hypothetical protein